MKDFYLHHRVVNRLEVKGLLTLKTALHIGGSHNEGRGVAKVIKDLFERAFLPGSSFKGALRSCVESIAHLILDEDVCHQVKDGSHACLSAQKGGVRELQNALKKEEMSEEALKALVQKSLCPTCQLFGGASWRSKASIDDLHPAETMVFPIECRDGVGIDRDTRQAARSVKYQFEAVPAGTQFCFRLLGENLSKQDLALLGIGILSLIAGDLSLGGKTSRGLGKVQLESIEANYWDINVDEHKKALLLGLPAPVPNGLKDWLEEEILDFTTGA